MALPDDEATPPRLTVVQVRTLHEQVREIAREFDARSIAPAIVEGELLIRGWSRSDAAAVRAALDWLLRLGRSQAVLPDHDL